MEDYTSPFNIWTKAEEVFGSSNDAFIWFHSKNILINNETPDAQMKTKFGRKIIFNMLDDIENNVRHCVMVSHI